MRSRGDESRLSRDRAAANCLPCAFQAGQLCSVEGITETARSQGGGFSGITSGIIDYDQDGCIDSRLGSSVRGNASFGTVAGISEPVALKSPGAGSSLLSSKGFSATAGPAKCTDSHRQHVCGFVHKSLRRVEIAPRVGSDDLEPLALRESGGGSVRQSENTHCLLFFTPR